MKTKSQSGKKIQALYLVGALFLLTGCGATGTSAASTYSTLCATGYTYSSVYGSCVLGSTYSSGACAAITGSIPFYGSGLEIDTSDDIYGGAYPEATSVGSMLIGTSAVSGTTFTSTSTGSTYSVGTFSMNVGSSTLYSSSTVAVSGTLTIGAYYQSVITEYLESLGYTTTAPCISGIAIQGHLYTAGEYGFGGNVYLYLNGLEHGVVLTYE